MIFLTHHLKEGLSLSFKKSESLERDLSNDVFQSKTSSEPKFDIFRPRTMGYIYIIHGIAKLANTFISQIRSLMTPFERSFSELSENHTLDPQNSSYSKQFPEPLIKSWRGNIFQQPLT